MKKMFRVGIAMVIVATISIVSVHVLSRSGSNADHEFTHINNVPVVNTPVNSALPVAMQTNTILAKNQTETDLNRFGLSMSNSFRVSVVQRKTSK